MTYTIRTATGIDCIELVERMTEADLYELELTPGSQPLQKLFRGLKESLNPIAIDDCNGVLAAIAGVVPQDSRCFMGSPWMLCTDSIGTEPISLIKQARAWTKSQSKQFENLEHKVWKGNHDHIKFLNLVGFTVLPAPSNSIYCPFFY